MGALLKVMPTRPPRARTFTVLRLTLVLVLSSLAAACATGPQPGPIHSPPPHGAPRATPSQPSPSPPRDPSDYPLASSRAMPVTDIPGWGEEDHAGALRAFATGCGVARDPNLRPACLRARSLGSVGEDQARSFFEREFRAEPLPGEGVLTAYFAPEYAARRSPEGAFSAPVRPKPSQGSGSLTYAVAAQPSPAQAAPPVDVIGRVLSGLDVDGFDEPGAPSVQPPSYRPQSGGGYVGVSLATADRTTIETAPAPDALAWMRPEELFFLQIQGSGTLVFPDGGRSKVIYAGDNGRAFTAIARPMVAEGLLTTARASGEGIRAWLASHAGPQADAVMRKNARYVFFAVLSDDGRDPAGAAGVSLPPGRSLAVDPGRHGYGELYWIDASAPILTGATKRYRRLAMALDTGAAIRGEVRADLYVGRGGAAGEEAGRVRHTLHMVRLVPAVQAEDR
ncbi:MltA domain-containing protein [soil metagenome]